MSTWDQLRAELDLWQSEERIATMWWRDDDAVAVTPALETMLAFEQDYSVPLALAVIPADLEHDLVLRLAETLDTRVLQHGWSMFGISVQLLPIFAVVSKFCHRNLATVSFLSWCRHGTGSLTMSCEPCHRLDCAGLARLTRARMPIPYPAF